MFLVFQSLSINTGLLKYKRQMNTQQKTAVSQLYSPSSGFYNLSTPSSLMPCSLNLGGRRCYTDVPVRPEHKTVTFLYTLTKFDFVGLCICLHLLQKVNFAQCVYCRTLNYECIILHILFNMYESEVDHVKQNKPDSEEQTSYLLLFVESRCKRMYICHIY